MKDQLTVSRTASQITKPPISRSRRAALGSVVIALILIGASVPYWLADQPFILLLAGHAAIAALVAISLDILMGNTGLLSFGHAAWYGFGAYVAGMVATFWTSELLIVVPITMAACALAALVVGYVLVQQTGKAFAILTLAFSQVLLAAVLIGSDVTGGEDGLQGIPLPTIAGLEIFGQDIWYWVIYSILVAVVCGAFFVRNAPLGKAWLGLRENTERAEFIGVEVFQLKLISYVAAACIAALAGSLFVLFNGATSPETLHWFESGKILIYVILGGVGTIVGPALGAILFTFAEHYISSITDAWLMYLGALFVVIIIVMPGGIVGALKPFFDRLLPPDRGGK